MRWSKRNATGGGGAAIRVLGVPHRRSHEPRAGLAIVSSELERPRPRSSAGHLNRGSGCAHCRTGASVCLAACCTDPGGASTHHPARRRSSTTGRAAALGRQTAIAAHVTRVRGRYHAGFVTYTITSALDPSTPRPYSCSPARPGGKRATDKSQQSAAVNTTAVDPAVHCPRHRTYLLSLAAHFGQLRRHLVHGRRGEQLSSLGHVRMQYRRPGVKRREGRRHHRQVERCALRPRKLPLSIVEHVRHAARVA